MALDAAVLLEPLAEQRGVQAPEGVAMKVLVCGGRDMLVYDLVDRVLTKFLLPGDTVVHGDARGADALCDHWARAHSLKVMAYPADWQTYGRGAGPKRNQRMLDEERPDLVIAFPGGKRTADMVRRARKAGVVVVMANGEAGKSWRFSWPNPGAPEEQ